MKPNENVSGLICCNLSLSHLHFLEIWGLTGTKSPDQGLTYEFFQKSLVLNFSIGKLISYSI